MKTLNLSAIKSGLNSLRNLGHETDTFVSRGIEFKIRTITRSELIIANELAQDLLEIAQEAETSYALSNWIKKVQHGVLSFALLRVGDLDLEEIDFIADDTDPSNPRKVQKAIFLRELLGEWEESMIDLVYEKFQELTSEAERKSKDGVKFLSKAPDEILEEKELEVAKLREELGLRPLEPVQKTRDSSKAEETPPGPVEEDVDVRALKHRMLEPVSPSSRPAPAHLEERDGYIYELPPEPVKDYTQTSPQPHAQEAPVQQQAPLTEEEMLADEHERLYQERQQRQQERQPLNQTPVHVRADDSANASRRIANAPQPVQDAQFIPNPNGAELLSPSTRQKGEGSSNFQANQKPRGKGNPNFYNPNRRQ